MELKQELLQELDSRIQRLQEHEEDEKDSDGNQYRQLNHALSAVIGTSLKKELQDLRNLIEQK